MATVDQKLKRIISLRYLKPLLFIFCVVSLFFIFSVYGPDTSSTGVFTMTTDTIGDEHSLPESIRSASLLENTELVKVIASSGLFSRLSKAIIALDPQMVKKNIVLKSLERIDVYTVLKASMEQEEGSQAKLKADPKSQQTQAPEPQAAPTVKPQEQHKPTTNLPLVSKPKEEAMTKPEKDVSVTPRKKIDAMKPNCQEPQLAELEKIYHVDEVQCDKLLSGDHDEMVRAVDFVKGTHRELLSNEFYMNSSANCPEFKKSRGYVMCPLTVQEEDFPIAYSFVVFKDIEMVERLLRSIYRPQNYYCIHVDQKADQKFFHAITEIASCFENVFIPPERIDVQWGKFSVLEPELVCMEHLWKYKKWKYFINLTGQEFPLKTNWELVQILKAYNGANDLEGTVKRANKDRWKSSPPHDLTATKGSVHITVNRDFVDFILHNQTSKDLLEWVKNTGVPDETFFATLNHNPQLGIRGTYKGEPETGESESMVKPFLTRFKNWGGYPFNYHCAGQYVRDICILSTGDLPLLGSAKHLFANKFYLWEDPVVIGCLEEMLFNYTRDELSGVKLFNTTYYSQLGFVQNQVT